MHTEFILCDQNSDADCRNGHSVCDMEVCMALGDMQANEVVVPTNMLCLSLHARRKAAHKQQLNALPRHRIANIICFQQPVVTAHACGWSALTLSKEAMEPGASDVSEPVRCLSNVNAHVRTVECLHQ